MTLCPLFESIVTDTTKPMMIAGVFACNDALPREAIEAAIVAMEGRAFYARVPAERAHYNDYIEQLQTLLSTDS